MFRSLFILLSKAKWAQSLIMNWNIARKMTTRFVAGDNLSDAIGAIKVLNSRGIKATLDHLGEHTTNPQEANTSAQAIIAMIDSIVESGIQSNVSIKLSQIGFTLDGDYCIQNLKKILEYAKQHGVFIRIDMEDSSTVDKTIVYYRQMRSLGFDNVGLVIQSYLYRSEKDVRDLMVLYSPIRLCKGAYKEPSHIAYPSKKDVDGNYDLLMKILLDTSVDPSSPKASKDGRMPPIAALATHDEKRINIAKQYIEKMTVPRDGVEFQMLYGIRRDIQDQLVKDGYSVRVYVPYGTQWYPYFMRRLAERPANLWFLLSNYFR